MPAPGEGGREGTARAATATRGTARLSTREPARHSSGHCFSQDTRFLVFMEAILLVSHHVPSVRARGQRWAPSRRVAGGETLLYAPLAPRPHAPMGAQSTSPDHIQLSRLSEPPSLQSQSRTPSFPWLGADGKPSPPGDALPAPVPTSAPREGAVCPQPAARVPLGAAGRMRARLPADVSAGSCQRGIGPQHWEHSGSRAERR